MVEGRGEANRDAGGTDTLSGVQWREEETMKGGNISEFRIQSEVILRLLFKFTSVLLKNLPVNRKKTS